MSAHENFWPRFQNLDHSEAKHSEIGSARRNSVVRPRAAALSLVLVGIVSYLFRSGSLPFVAVCLCFALACLLTALLCLSRGRRKPIDPTAKLLEARLEALRIEAETADDWKDRLLANIAHELRTPLNAVLGFSEILADPRLEPREAVKQREYARIIHSSAEHLLSIVNLVLDMSRIEGGRFEILREPFDIAQLIASCCDMLRLKAEAAGVEFVRSSQTSLELVADKRACRQILLNLMSNAVKFTPAGGKVFVTAEIVGDAYHLCVADNGIGIAEDHLPRLGYPFYQVRPSCERGHEGAGLGLALVRGLVGLHGGALLLESVAGEGTRVTVRLPIDDRTLIQLPATPSRLETAARFGPTQGVERVFRRREPRKAPESGEKKIA